MHTMIKPIPIISIYKDYIKDFKKTFEVFYF